MRPAGPMKESATRQFLDGPVQEGSISIGGPGRRPIMKVRPKVAFVFTHQIQYFTNVLDELHRRGTIEVLAVYAHQTGRLHDVGFKRVIEWDNRTDRSFRSVLLSDSAKRQLGGFSNSFSRELFSALARFDPDVIHLNGYSTAIQWLGWLWALLHRRPIILRGDGDTLGGNHGKRHVIARTSSSLFTRFADHVFYQGEENRRYWLARDANAARLSWIPCVPDNLVFRTSAFADQEERRNVRLQGRAGDDDVVFVVSGKLDPRKRPADALMALKRLNDGRCRVWFLGSGPLETELRALAVSLGVDDRVCWWGFRNQTEMPRILQAADVLLHLSERDPWPYSVLEGAMSGLALLLSDCTGSHPDLIQAAGAGETFICGNIEDLQKKMSSFLENPSVRTAYKKAALVESRRYSEASFCDIFEKTTTRLVDGTLAK